MQDNRRNVFRNNLRWLLETRNLSQADLSLNTGLPYKWIRRLCHHGLARTDRRSLGRLQQLAQHLEIEVADFWRPRDPVSQIGQCKLFRYVGSKYRIAKSIVSRFPVQIETYYEPFLGSGAVLQNLIDSDLKVENYVCSDICRPLIGVWRLVQSKPSQLAAQYENWYKNFQVAPEATFANARNELNATGDPIVYYFLNRTCRLGQMGFNKDGDLVSGLHFGLNPIDPQSVFLLARDWQSKLNSVEVTFKARDYANVGIGKRDFAYLDPPYFTTASYRHKFSSRRFFNWLRKQRPQFALSLGFGQNSEKLLALPSDFQTDMYEFDTGSSAIARLRGQRKDSVTERLYVSHITGHHRGERIKHGSAPLINSKASKLQ